MSDFILDPRLENDSVFLCDLKLCQARLHKNAAFPWILLIPKRPDIVEILDLNDEDQDTLYNETLFAANMLKKLYKPTKINIATLGNVVPQLHMHVIARSNTDKAWPQPVWNSGVKDDYSPEDLESTVQQLQKALSL